MPYQARSLFKLKNLTTLLNHKKTRDFKKMGSRTPDRLESLSTKSQLGPPPSPKPHISGTCFPLKMFKYSGYNDVQRLVDNPIFPSNFTNEKLSG